MIVTCEQCKTRFKIPDEKVTEKGVKVKCAKCGHMFRVAKEAGAAAAAPTEPDPFARFAGQAPSNSPTQPDLAPPIPPAAKPAPTSSGAFDFSSLAPPAPGGASPAPFDFSALVPPSGSSTGAPLDLAALAPPAVPKSTAPAAAVAPMAFDFSTLGAAAAAPPAPAAPPRPKPQPAKAAESTAAFDFSALGSAPAVSPAPPAARAAAPAPAPKAAPPPLDLDDALPTDLNKAPRANEGLFDSMEDLAPRPSPTSTSTARNELFDMSAAAPVPQPEAPVEPSLALTTEDLAPAPKPQPVALPRSISLPKLPVGKTRTALGVVANLVVAFVLVAALAVVGTALLNDGRLDAKTFSVQRLKALWFSDAKLLVADVSNGLYDTKAGRPVFYVRGEVDNRSTDATKAEVVVELLRGDTVVRTGVAWAGAVPTPEELFNLSSPDDLEALQTQLQKRATQVTAGSKAPFAFAVFEYPPDLQAIRVRAFVKDAQTATAAR